MSWLCRLRWSTALTTGLRRYSDVTSSSGGAAVRRAQLLALKGGRRLPTVKRSRRQLGISMVNPVAETAETRLSCSDPQQQATMQEMFRSGRREWDSAFEEYGRISNPEPALTTAILALAEKCGRVTEALDLYTELRWKKELSARMCNHVIRLAGRVHSALARGVLADMKNCQLEPNVYNYLALLELYKTERNANGARELWKQMRQEAVAGSDEVMLCSVMSVVAKSGDVKGTEALMLEAEATFPIITPHFNCCLDACHVAGDADSAFRILEEMQAASCRPDVIYNSSLGALDRAGRGKEDRDRLLQEMAKNEVKPNELFVDRHICSVLGIQKGAQVSAEWISRLPEEAVKEVREILRQTEVARLRQSKLVREVRSLLGANVSQSTDESSNESGAKRSAEALGGAATDWVKVLGKDEAGSIIEYFWDRSSGRTQWEPPDGPVHETVSA